MGTGIPFPALPGPAPLTSLDSSGTPAPSPVAEPTPSHVAEDVLINKNTNLNGPAPFLVTEPVPVTGPAPVTKPAPVATTSTGEGSKVDTPPRRVTRRTAKADISQAVPPKQ
ncbi:cyclin-dependent kinase inhibitor 1C-like [Dioscorea cayenensis subsp. rotundata]|uniref:Cyclin-dependent kinase inhibitor 1C-like n=1 Tax=Dioscorea cayennensis subsp. rotundata TaxID=55577 RepID=A0AB40ASZ7_DIOCR|nr:cyclin-dependent kinase inhibitor 1C-like [Dioscorea cayenensis subsp. rotundata]